MEKRMHNYWQEKQLVGYDCLIFSNGEVILFNVYTQDIENKKQIYCLPFCDTTIHGLEKYDDDIWTEIDIYNTSIDYNNGQIISGEGSMGNEGFVAHLDKNNEFNWAFFFTFSNPIIQLEIKDKYLHCHSSNDIEVIIDLNNLTSIKVEKKDHK